LAGVAGTFEIGVEHFAERHGLMIIIVLGESIVSVAQAAQHLSLTGPLIAGALCGLAAAAAMWWCYFGGDDEAGATALSHAAAPARATRALVGYDLSHVLMMAGVVAAAAGARLSLPVLTHATSGAAAVLIAAGPAVYLCGLAAFRATLKHGKPTGRLAAAVLTIATVPIGTYLGAAQQLLGVAIILTMLIVVERRATYADER
jgi:low temperature requirement protein LtrA